MNVTIWNEGLHESRKLEMLQFYPNGLHGAMSEIVQELPDVGKVRTATLQDPECGLPPQVLEDTDVLFWWGHIAHDQVPDELVERIYDRVMRGMGLVVLHSGHRSKIFMKLLGTSMTLSYKHGDREKLFCTAPTHPIAAGLPACIELPTEEMYGEYFDIPKPDDLIFISWFDSGEVFRSGCTWYRGRGKIFYFQPGHETNRSFNHPVVRRILQNACRWAAPTNPISKEMDIWHCEKLVNTLEEERREKEQ